MGFSLTPEFKKALHEDGVIKAEGLLDPDQLALCRRCLDWSIADPGP